MSLDVIMSNLGTQIHLTGELITYIIIALIYKAIPRTVPQNSHGRTTYIKTSDHLRCKQVIKSFLRTLQPPNATGPLSAQRPDDTAVTRDQIKQ